MKTKMLLAILVSITGFHANAEISSVVLSDQTIPVTVDISVGRVKLSKADYSSEVVKILVPGLADVTLLDHRNTNEGAPCLATYEARQVSEVIQSNPAIETVPMNIKLVKQIYPDVKARKCHVQLFELIETNIRGFKFEHMRSISVGTRHLDDCR